MLRISELENYLIQKPFWLLDGAVGTELESRGYPSPLPFWTSFAARDCPQLLKDIYLEYLDAGSLVLTANTFRISHYLFEKTDRLAELQALLIETCDLTRSVRLRNRIPLVAASLAPLEDCYRPDLTPSANILHHYHEKQLTTLAPCNVDFILAETINTLAEAEVIMKLTTQMSLPLILSVISDGKGSLLSGEPLNDLVKIAHAYNPIALSLNCRSIYDLEYDAGVLSDQYEGRKAIYCNASGKTDKFSGWQVKAGSSRELTEFIGKMQAQGFSIFGGCCGTTPTMIEAIHQYLLAPGGS